MALEEEWAGGEEERKGEKGEKWAGRQRAERRREDCLPASISFMKK